MTEIIIYAAIAFGLCAVLYALLGRDIGHSGEQTFLNTEFGPPPEKSSPASEFAIEGLDVSDRAAQGLRDIFAADNSFRPKHFVDGAIAAYAMILEAYAEGDRETLGELLTDDVYAAYDDGITQRDKDGYTQVTDIARIISASIEDAEVEGGTSRIDIRFVAELASALKNEDGEIIQGDLNMVSRVDEVWTFERSVGSANPAWLLAAVEEEGEDTPGSAPDVSKS